MFEFSIFEWLVIIFMSILSLVMGIILYLLTKREE
jgi:hypothetical protein